MDPERSYEPPQLVVLGTVEEITGGDPIGGMADLAFFYRRF